MSGKIRVLIVDDSAFARFSISKQLSSDPEIEIIDTARNGIEALAKIKDLKPDVVTLDVEMPQMDGLTALGHIMSDYPTPVVMLSSLTVEGTDTTFKALNLGAVDFFAKPSPTAPAGVNDDVVGDLVAKVKVAAGIDRLRLKVMVKERLEKPRTIVPSRNIEGIAKRRQLHSPSRHRLIILGSSTGGPRALNELIPMLPGDLPAAILMVQHMPVGFTKSLAERLNDSAELDVKEAQTGDILSPGLALLARGGYHMTVDANGKIGLNMAPQECGLRPAVNVTMESAAQHYGKTILGVVLTGMGNDGTRGCGLIKDVEGEVIVEDQSTCVVYGMPRSIVDSGYADSILPLHRIADEIVKRCQVDSTVIAGGVHI
ncbi:MAG: chemotaxis response regulator protein-glutamate methylesterase [Chloroflexota bacterium]|nr:chemotaxis response regulator protein-glutamate methylesterase [Chloroflexota bacterium]